MGNYKFRLSNMMPNAWFYKLRDFTKTAHHHHRHHPIKKKLPSPNSRPRPGKFRINSPTNPKASDTQFPDHHPPRNSSNKKSKHTKTIYKPSPPLATSSSTATCSCRAARNSLWPKAKPPRPPPRHYLSPSTDQISTELSSCIKCRVSSSTTDIIIDLNEKSFSRKIEKIDGFEFDVISELHLPPISTKPKVVKLNDTTRARDSNSTSQKESKTSHLVRNSASSPGVNLGPNPPGIAGGRRRSTTVPSSSSKNSRSRRRRRRSSSQSFAIVKLSRNPERDFKESMVEMIAENHILASKDLEDLLARYLSLNSDEYHGLIVKMFQQIWFDMYGPT